MCKANIRDITSGSLKCSSCDRQVRLTYTTFFDGVNPDPEMIVLVAKCICGNEFYNPLYLRQEARNG